MNCKVEIDYTNYRGERAKRIVVPHNIFHGTTDYHPDAQWLMSAWDIEKKAIRMFAMADIHSLKNLRIEGMPLVPVMKIEVVASDSPRKMDMGNMTPQSNATASNKQNRDNRE